MTIRSSMAIVVLGTGLTLLLLLLFVGFKTHSPLVENVKTNQAEPSPTKAIANVQVYGSPERLTIPKIGVDTNIVPMGLTLAGNLQAPDTNEAAGWYKSGPNPGNTGSAVIDGHFGLGNIKAVFSKLGTLQKGDTIIVTDDLGKTSSFFVRTTKLYDQDAQPTEVFNSATGSHLNLITCDGVWEQGQQTYTQRLVVFADKA